MGEVEQVKTCDHSDYLSDCKNKAVISYIRPNGTIGYACSDHSKEAIYNYSTANFVKLKKTPTETEESVIEKIYSRREAGRNKYGTTMERTDLTRKQWLVHAQEEAMDFVIYLEKLIKLEEKQEW